MTPLLPQPASPRSLELAPDTLKKYSEKVYQKNPSLSNKTNLLFQSPLQQQEQGFADPIEQSRNVDLRNMICRAGDEHSVLHGSHTFDHLVTLGHRQPSILSNRRYLSTRTGRICRSRVYVAWV